MMLLSLIKKDFLIVKKHVFMLLAFAVLIPPFMFWWLPEFTGALGFMLSVVMSVFMLLQYVAIKEYQYPKAVTLLCATPFPRSMIVLSKYIFCMAGYVVCCIVYGIETFVIPGLGVLDIKLFAVMFFATSVYIGVYLPVQYKLGFDKTKYIFTVVCVTAPMTLPQLLRMLRQNAALLITLSSQLVCGGIMLISLAVLVISAALSIRIYDKTDLT